MWGGWRDAQFEIEKQDGPIPATPADDELLPQPDSPPLLNWTSLQGALEYEVQVDRDDNFLTAKTYKTYTTSLLVPDQVADGDYSWRVRARLGSGIYSAFSVTQHYKIGPLAQVTGATPDNAFAHHEDVVLKWDPVDGAAEYELWVSTDPDFNDTSRTVLKDTIVSTRYSPPTTFLNDQYYWKVRAVNAQGEFIDWTDPRVPRQIVRRDWQPAPELVHPSHQVAPAAGDDFYFEWKPVRLASSYELNVGTDPNFSPGTYSKCETAGTTYTAGHLSDPCMPSQGNTYFWRVRGIDDPKGVQGIYSEVRTFIYNSGPVARPHRPTARRCLFRLCVGRHIVTPRNIELRSRERVAATRRSRPTHSAPRRISMRSTAPSLGPFKPSTAAAAGHRSTRAEASRSLGHRTRVGPNLLHL